MGPEGEELCLDIKTYESPQYHWKLETWAREEKELTKDWKGMPEIKPEYSLEGLMLKLKLQYFGHLIRRSNSLEKSLMVEKIEDRRRTWDGWTVPPTLRTWVWVNSRRPWRTGNPGLLQSMGLQRVGHDLTDWTRQRRNTRRVYCRRKQEWSRVFTLLSQTT